MRVRVRSKVPGASREAMPDVLIELAGERITARQLISSAVEEQIRLLRMDSGRCRDVLDRQYLSAQEIRAQAATGVVRMPQPVLDVDVATEVTRAHRAFERGVFVVFVDGHQVDALDEELELRLGEPVTFLRLTALVGG